MFRAEAEANLGTAKEKMSTVKEASETVDEEMDKLEAAKKDEQKQNKAIIRYAPTDL